MTAIRNLIRDESGQTMVEYGLLIALISIAVIAVLVLLGPRIASFFTAVDDELARNQPPAAAV
jgi:pilus assembly protein Flp/PilA